MKPTRNLGGGNAVLSDELNNVSYSAVWARFAPTVSAESREKGWPVHSAHPPRSFAFGSG